MLRSETVLICNEDIMGLQMLDDRIIYNVFKVLQHIDVRDMGR